MGISQWPVAERPRGKLLSKGATALSDAELLAIFLRIGVQGKSAVDLARNLLDEFGSLRALLAADLPSFCDRKGSVKPSTYNYKRRWRWAGAICSKRSAVWMY